jgi:aminoglycoside phosphotransferase family enzyme
MSNQPILKAKDAQLEIASIILRRSREGKIEWVDREGKFCASVAEGVRATLNCPVGAQLVDAGSWEEFKVEDVGKVLVDYFRESPLNKVLGNKIAPSEIGQELDSLFANLQKKLVQSRYGPALDKLRSLT